MSRGRRAGSCASGAEAGRGGRAGRARAGGVSPQPCFGGVCYRAGPRRAGRWAEARRRECRPVAPGHQVPVGLEDVSRDAVKVAVEAPTRAAGRRAPALGLRPSSRRRLGALFPPLPPHAAARRPAKDATVPFARNPIQGLGADTPRAAHDAPIAPTPTGRAGRAGEPFETLRARVTVGARAVVRDDERRRGRTDPTGRVAAENFSGPTGVCACSRSPARRKEPRVGGRCTPPPTRSALRRTLEGDARPLPPRGRGRRDGARTSRGSGRLPRTDDNRGAGQQGSPADRVEGAD